MHPFEKFSLSAVGSVYDRAQSFNSKLRAVIDRTYKSKEAYFKRDAAFSPVLDASVFDFTVTSPFVRI